MTDNITKLFEGAIVLDTETTSLDFKEAEVIEYSSASVMQIVETVAAGEFSVPTTLYSASKPLKPEVSAITNISRRMIDGCDFFTDHLQEVQEELDKHQFFIAHNAFYDQQVLERQGLKMPKTLCTMRLAQRLYADDNTVTAFNLPYLRYALDVDVPDHLIAHRADADVIVTGMLFTQLFAKAIEDGHISEDADDLGQELYDWLSSPVIITKMPFGKHKGTPLNEVPISYWQWALENMDSLQEDKPEYDRDFAASVEKAITEIFEAQD